MDSAKLKAAAEAERLVGEAEKRAASDSGGGPDAGGEGEGGRATSRPTRWWPGAGNPLARSRPPPPPDRLRKEADDKSARIVQEADQRANALVAEARKQARAPAP